MTPSRHPRNRSPEAAEPARHQRRWAPPLSLVLLAPFVGELLLGNTPVRLFFVYLVTLPMYGGGALLIREVSRRAGRGWPTIVTLGVAYGVVEEGLGDMSLFNPDFYGEHLLGYGNLLGIGWPWWLYVLTLHAVWSIGVSIGLAEALFADRGTDPWLGRPGLGVTAAVFVLGTAAIHFGAGQGYRLSVGQLVLCLVLVIALIAIAFAWPRSSRPRTPASAPPPRPAAVAGVGLAAGSLFLVLTRPLADLLGLPAGVLIAGYFVLYLTVGVLAGRWSRRLGWTDQHRFGLVAGAMLAYTWYGFVQVPHDLLDLVGQAVFAAIAIGLIILAWQRVRSVGSAGAYVGSAPPGAR